MLYIGEGDPVRPRLDSHYANKDFWTRAVFFVAPSQLNKAHVQYLEAQLVSCAQAAKRMPLENGNQPKEPTLNEADRADMEVFLQNILGMLPVLGVQAFEPGHGAAVAGTQPLLTCSGRGITATGVDTPQGFVVRSGIAGRHRGEAVAGRAFPEPDRTPGPPAGKRRPGGGRDRASIHPGFHLQFPVAGVGGGAGAAFQRAHRLEGRQGSDPEAAAGGAGPALNGGGFCLRRETFSVYCLTSSVFLRQRQYGTLSDRPANERSDKTTSRSFTRRGEMLRKRPPAWHSAASPMGSSPPSSWTATP